MKLKGVSTLEQNIEKIVLVAVSVVFLAVIAMQALLEPNRVKVGSNPPVPPGQAYAPVANKANVVKAAIERTDPETPAVSVDDLAQRFRDRFAAPVAPDGVSIALGQPLQVEGSAVSITFGADSAARVADIAVPAPTGVTAASYWMAIDPAEAVNNEDLLALLPKEQPFDKAAVSVEATFDGTALRKAFLADPDGEEGPVRAMPAGWWQATGIFAVRLEREELAGTGEWTGLTEVAPPPARVNLLPEMTKQVVSAPDMVTWLGEAERQAAAIQRPEFYRIYAGQPWLPPAEAVRLDGGARPPEVDREIRTRTDRLLNRERLQQALDARRGGARQPRGGDGEMMQPGRGGRANQSAEPREDPYVAQLEQRIKRIDDEVKVIDERIIALGFDPVTGSPRATGVAAETGRALPLLEDAKVRVWSHDLTVEPGKTYRYRVRVLVSNPAFGRGASMVPEQQDLAKRLLLDGQPSEWTEAVTVPPATAYFVVGASEGGQLGSQPGASVEVYQMFYGFYRRGGTRLEPGDAILAEVKLPETVQLPIWDLEKLKAPEEGGEVPPPALPPGRGAAGLPPGAPGEPEGPAPLPEGATAWTTPIRVSLETVLLDVARQAVSGEQALGAGRAQFQAFLRRQDGTIEVRVPDEDRDSALYNRVKESAAQGETQGAPPPPKEGEKVPPPPPPGEVQEFGEGGGGGGG